jgi:mono/diheme cytochrome c family protein
MSEGMWAQQNGQNESGAYSRSPGMCGGWNGYDNCMEGYGNNNGYAPGQMSGSSSIPPVSSTAVSFSRDVQPVFNARCVSCHGGTEGLFLDSYVGVVNGSMGWPVVIPGDPINSRLIQLVSSGYMPYGGPSLNQDQIQKLVDWVAAGALNN